MTDQDALQGVTSESSTSWYEQQVTVEGNEGFAGPGADAGVAEKDWIEQKASVVLRTVRSAGQGGSTR